MNVLYVGSGRSALMSQVIDRSKLITCAVNNAWRLFTEPFEYWIHSGDFPRENHPPERCFKHEIGHKEYEQTAAEIGCQSFPGEKYPQHRLGYTIFFQGLYWIMQCLHPERIYTLGFDHDYSPDKVKQWVNAGRPNPQNQHCGLPLSFFTEHNLSDSFYGHGTPDPMRLGEEHLKIKFELAEHYAQKVGIKLVNISGITTGLNTFPQGTIQ